MKTRMFLMIMLVMMLLPACTKPAPAFLMEPCTLAGIKAECGSLPVYENRAAGSGRIIKLNLAVIRSSGTNRAADAVVLLSGGPGVAATQDTYNFQSLLPILGDRDLLLVDQRGTGGSNEVYPPQTPDWSGLSPEELENAYAAWIKKVLPKMGADPRFYTSSVAMDDLDQIREVLGYEQLDLIGESYGAFAAQYYLRQHESHVRSMVLIAGSFGNLPIWEHQAANAQQVLEALFARCENDPACHKAFPNVRNEFAALMQKLDAEPVNVEVGSETVTLTSEFFAAKVEDMTRDAGRAAALPRLIHKAYAEYDWQTFASALYGDWSNLIMSYSIQCNEKWASFSPEETSRWGQDSYLLGWNLSRANRYTLVCKYLPDGVDPAGDSNPPLSQVPVLLFNGELDPLNPPANVAAAKDVWPNSLALTLPGQGHSIGNGLVFSCMRQIMRQFLQDGSTQQLNSDCLQDIHSPAFATYP